MWFRYIIGIAVLAVVAYVALYFLTPPFSTVVSAICGVGEIVLLILLIVDLIRGGSGTTRA